MTLTATRLKRVIERYHEGLRHYRDALNRLNVYPVPDGDTGTNMSLTMASVMDAAADAESMEEVAEAISHGSLMGARGNSGIILSQILRGLAETFRACDDIGAVELADALNRASDAAYDSVVRPVEGTILTVMREAATGARETGTEAGADLGAFLERVYARAEEALENTPELLPVLKQAGVVDAGGAGLLLLLAAFVEETTGTTVEMPLSLVEAAAAGPGVVEVTTAERPDVADLRYEVMFFLESTDGAVAELRSAWVSIGDSIVVVGGDGTYNCHIHTDDIGAAIEAGIGAGRPFDIKVTDLLEQAADAAHHGFQPLEAFAAADIGVVAVVAGDGLVEAYRDLGVQGVVTGGQSMNPSTQELLAAVDAVAAQTVVLLPNNKNIIPVAGRVDALTDKTVHVVPTRSIPQGIAAMLAYLPDGDSAAIVAGMGRSARSVVSGEITRAVRDSETPIGRVAAGDWLGIVDGDIVIATDVPPLQQLLAQTLEPGSELITVFYGQDHEAEVLDEMEAWLGEHHPDVELETIDGGQPLYPYLLSIE